MIVFKTSDNNDARSGKPSAREITRRLAAVRCLGVRSAVLPTPSSTPLVLKSVDPDCNKARFYALSVEPTLFGDTALVRHWGRIGTKGRHRIDLYSSLQEAWQAADVIARSKRRRGYREAALAMEVARDW
jgi:predicted DNA-binding WGR domain protein